MIIPVVEQKPSIDFTPFMELLEEKHGWNYRDMAGKYTTEGQEEARAAREAWLVEAGYASKGYVLEKPTADADWAQDSEEMALRIKINNEMREVSKTWERPYQDVWHWLMANDFSDLERGGNNYLWLNDERFAEVRDGSMPDYVEKVLRAIWEEVKDHPSYDGEMVQFHVDW